MIDTAKLPRLLQGFCNHSHIAISKKYDFGQLLLNDDFTQ